MEDGDIMCLPILVPTCLQEVYDTNAKVGAEPNPQKTEVIFYVNDLGAPIPKWRIDDVQNMGKVSTVTAGSITHGVAVGPLQFIEDQLLAMLQLPTVASHSELQLGLGSSSRTSS